MRGARIFLGLVGVVALAFGVLYVVAPAVLLDQTGFPDLGPEATTDVRATYGGLQIALGAFTLWCAAQPRRYRAGLMLVTIAFAAIASCRAVGLLIDGDPSSAMISALVLEVAVTAISFFMLRRVDAGAGRPV
jgi:hypothetical protein